MRERSCSGGARLAAPIFRFLSKSARLAGVGHRHRKDANTINLTGLQCLPEEPFYRYLSLLPVPSAPSARRT